MPRPRKIRCVAQKPVETFFKPAGVPLEKLTGITLSIEGLEALRLADAEEMSHDAAAEKMNISRPTFSRILNEARRTVAKALSSGWAIRIDGGDYDFTEIIDGSRGMRGRGGRCRRKKAGDSCGP